MLEICSKITLRVMTYSIYLQKYTDMEHELLIRRFITKEKFTNVDESL